MTKTEIFDDVVSIMHNDSSTCKDKQGGDESHFRAQITDDMDDEKFLFVMRSYLATFGLTGHLAFYRKEGRGSMGFEVRRYQDALYVDDIAENSLLRVGDRIVEVDGISVKEFAEAHADFLYGETEERQAPHWAPLLSFFREVTVEGEDGARKHVPITLDAKWKQEEPYVCKKLRDDVAYLYLADFANEEQLQKLYQANEEVLSGTPYLVIDVRRNGGGTDTAYFPLLRYCLPEGKALEDLGLKEQGMEVNYTERNVKERLKFYSEYKEQAELPEETLAMINSMEAEAKEHCGEGFVQSLDDFTISVKGAAEAPKRVYILSDCYCGSTGDAFVENVSISPKVTVVGRPTWGVLDYSNLNMITYGSYGFAYPTSRRLSLDEGIHMMGCGVPVQVHVPWTPEHLTRDVDLEKVFELIDDL